MMLLSDHTVVSPVGEQTCANVNAYEQCHVAAHSLLLPQYANPARGATFTPPHDFCGSATVLRRFRSQGKLRATQKVADPIPHLGPSQAFVSIRYTQRGLETG